MNRKGFTFYIDNVLYIEKFRIARKCDFNIFNEDSLVSLLFMFLYCFPNLVVLNTVTCRVGYSITLLHY